MKKLNFLEIQKLLTKEEIETALSRLLISSGVEYFIESLKDNQQWNDPNFKIFYISTNFTNLNWLYYKHIIKQLKPRGLNISSSCISRLPGLGKITTLETISLCGESNLDCLYLSSDEVKSILNECFKLPTLKKVEINAFSGYENEKSWIKEIGAYVSNFCPESELEGYGPLVINLKHSKESSQISDVETRN